MGSASKFSALNTKLQAMNAKLLKTTDYDILLGFSTEKEIGNYLKHNTRYSGILSEYSIDKLKRWEFELILKKEMLVELEKLSNYLSSDYKKFLDIMFLRAEVEDIKLILRAISRKEDLMELPEHFLHSKEHEFISFEKLLSKNNLFDLVEEFKGSIYEDAFRSITEDDLKLREFHAEMNLDAIYFKELRKSVEKLSADDRSILEYIIGINIDLINIQWIYRAKRYYNLMNEEIFNYTLSGGLKLNFKKIKKLIYSEDCTEQTMELLNKYGFKLKPSDDKYLQVVINRYLAELIKKMDRNNPMTITKFIKYTHDVEFEAADIITILEGVRYKSAEIKKLLIRGGEEVWQ
ncbi:MAG: V-type ATPase subunit [Proteocatella sp.]